jgi:hypothetical protein
LELDDDGILDVVVARSDGLAAFHALGDGEFAEPVPYEGPELGSKISAQDMNADGLADIVGLESARDSGPQQHLVVFLRMPAGGLMRAEDIPWANPESSHPWSYCFGDVTGDGRDEFAAVLQGTSTGVAIYGVDPLASALGDPKTYEVGSGENRYCATGDFNDDALVDLAIAEDANGYEDRTWVLAQDAAGELQDPLLIGTYGWSGALAGGDLDNDGRDDLVRIHSSKLSVLLQTDDGLGAPAYYAYPDASSEANLALALGDVDCDGCRDIVAANVTGLVVFHGRGCSIE